MIGHAWSAHGPQESLRCIYIYIITVDRFNIIRACTFIRILRCISMCILFAFKHVGLVPVMATSTPRMVQGLINSCPPCGSSRCATSIPGSVFVSFEAMGFIKNQIINDCFMVFLIMPFIHNPMFNHL